MHMSKYWNTMLKKYKKGLYFGDIKKYIEKDTEEEIVGDTEEERIIEEERRLTARQPIISDKERKYYTAQSKKVAVQRKKWIKLTPYDKQQLKQASIQGTQAARQRLLRKKQVIQLTVTYCHASIVKDDNAVIWQSHADVWSFFLHPHNEQHYMIYIIANHMHCCTTLHHIKLRLWQMNRQYVPYIYNIKLIYNEMYQGMTSLLTYLYPAAPMYQVILPDFEQYLNEAFDYQRQYTEVTDPHVYFYLYGTTPKAYACKRLAVPPCCKTLCRCGERYMFISNIMRRDLLSLDHIVFDYYLFIR